MKKQAGNVVEWLIIGVVLIGAVALIAWRYMEADKDQNAAEQAANDSSISQTSQEKQKTYTTDKYNISFEYPEKWSTELTYSSDEYSYLRVVKVKNENGKEMASMSTGGQGLGGGCDTPAPYHTLQSEQLKLPVEKSAFMSASVIQEEGKYTLIYGLTDRYTKIEEGKACPNTFYYFVKPTNTKLMITSFNNQSIVDKKKFDSIEDAKKYLNSAEYKQIKQVISSLKVES